MDLGPVEFIEAVVVAVVVIVVMSCMNRDKPEDLDIPYDCDEPKDDDEE